MRGRVNKLHVSARGRQRTRPLPPLLSATAESSQVGQFEFGLFPLTQLTNVRHGSGGTLKYKLSHIYVANTLLVLLTIIWTLESLN